MPVQDMLQDFWKNKFQFLNPFNNEYQLIMKHSSYSHVINNMDNSRRKTQFFVMSTYFPVGEFCLLVHFQY
jgi:hypothetical protein